MTQNHNSKLVHRLTSVLFPDFHEGHPWSQVCAFYAALENPEKKRDRVPFRGVNYELAMMYSPTEVTYSGSKSEANMY